MATYELCDGEIYQRVRALIRKNHPLLEKSGASVCLLFAYAPKDAETGTPTGPALTSNGYAAAAITKIANLKDRVKGMADAEIVIDGDSWEDWPLEQQEALLDHELTHLDPQWEGSEEKPRFLFDANERPLMKLKKHDHQYGWFNSVAERHGIHSFEVQQATRLYESHQAYFPFVKTTEPSVEDVLREARGGKIAKPKTRQTMDGATQ